MAASPTPTPADSMIDGVCEDSNVYFWGYFIGAVLMAVLVMYCRYRMVTPPTYGPSSSPDFGLPFHMAILIYNLCLWSLAPQVAMFVVFHVLTTDVFPMQTNCACIVLMSIPFLPAVLFPQATLLLLAYKPEAIRGDVGDVVVPEHTTEDATHDKPLKMLYLGCGSRGALLIDALDKEHRGTTHVEAHMVDYNHSYDGGFVRYNAKCLGVFDRLASWFHRSVWKDGDKFVLPFADASFDRVVVSPFMRTSLPVGELMTGDDVKIPRMVRLLREGMRVLRTDGELFAYDQVANIVPLWADLRDAGYTATIVDSQVTAGPIFFMKAKMLKLHCPYQTPCDVAENHITMDGSQHSPLVRGDVIGDDVAIQSTDFDLAPPPSEALRFSLIIPIQLCVYVAMMFLFVALYRDLSIPTTIPMSTRLATMFIGSANGYPLAAYFARDRLLSMDPPHRTVGALVRSCLLSECVGVLLSLFFSVFLGLPGFAMQLALADTSLSTSARSMIGIAISIALGLVLFKHGSKSHRT
ncbi:transmembrane protein, putative, partial [Bodo saltans]